MKCKVSTSHTPNQVSSKLNATVNMAHNVYTPVNQGYYSQGLSDMCSFHLPIMKIYAILHYIHLKQKCRETLPNRNLPYTSEIDSS